MLSQYLNELEQEPFDVTEFVERLAWRSTSGSGRGSKQPLQPDVLQVTFTQAIKDLELLAERSERRCERLEAEVKTEEAKHWRCVQGLLEDSTAAATAQQSLDGRLNKVAGRVVSLGDRLATAARPRHHAATARDLMTAFASYLDGGGGGQQPLGETLEELAAEAAVVQQLFVVSQELPPGKWSSAVARIVAHHDAVERALVERFVAAQRGGDTATARRLCAVLHNTAPCVDAFIEELMSTPMRDVFSEAGARCERAERLAAAVFAQPHAVTAKCVISVYQGPLKEHVTAKLQGATGEAYLSALHTLYGATVALSTRLAPLGLDSTLLPQLTAAVFQPYLATYSATELAFLKDRFEGIIARFYESKGHKKQNLGGGQGMKELRMHLADVLAGLGGGEGAGGESLLAEEVALSLLHESKAALARCSVLSNKSDLVQNAVRIYNLLTQQLVSEYVDYAIEISTAALPQGEAKSPPHLTLLVVVQQTSSVLHLLHKLLHDTLLPLLLSSPEHGAVVQRKKALVQATQSRLSLGLERLVGAAAQYTRHLLHTHQRRTDFRPEQDNMSLAGVTPACRAALQWLTSIDGQITRCLDGPNLDSLRQELGVRLHRTVLDHIQRFEYNPAGALSVICDVNEYRKFVAAWRLPLLAALYDTLHTLCKLLQVSPQNLAEVCGGDELSGLDRSVLATFIQLRADYKSAKLGAHFR